MQDQIKITIDDREPIELSTILKDKNLSIEKSRLQVADIIISNEIAAERKTRNDLESSIVDKRLFFQLKELAQNFKTAILIVEGTQSFQRINRNALIAALSSATLDGISIFFTRNIQETCELIYWLAKKSINRNNPKSLASKKPKDIKANAKLLIESLPGVGLKRANNFTKKFKTLKELANAEEQEILEIEGIGKNKAKQIYNLFNTNLQLKSSSTDND